MSIATERLSSLNVNVIQEVERDVREIAKEYGIRVKKNKFSGIDVIFEDGTKKHYYGWIQLSNDLIKVLDLAE